MLKNCSTKWTFSPTQTLGEALGESPCCSGQGMGDALVKCAKCHRSRSKGQFRHDPRDPKSRRYRTCARCRNV